MAAKPEETNAELAAELGLGESTVRKYRREAREARRAIAREVMERHVEDAMPNALDALGAALRLAKEQMDTERSPEWVRETRATAIALLDRMGVEKVKDPLEGLSDEVLLGEVEARLGLARK